jgi:hypothetical protein
MFPYPSMNRCLYCSPQAASGKLLLQALSGLLPAAHLLQAGGDLSGSEMLQKPDIIFLDGFTYKELIGVLESLRQRTTWKHVPVIITGKAYTALQTATAYNSGASLHFRQPSSYPVLVMGLHKILERRWLFPRTPLFGRYQLSA